MYNENGLRVQKTVNGAVTKYTLYGKDIKHMTEGSNELHFFYDAQNKPAVVVFRLWNEGHSMSIHLRPRPWEDKR